MQYLCSVHFTLNKFYPNKILLKSWKRGGKKNAEKAKNNIIRPTFPRRQNSKTALPSLSVPQPMKNVELQTKPMRSRRKSILIDMLCPGHEPAPHSGNGNKILVAPEYPHQKGFLLENDESKFFPIVFMTPLKG